MVASMNLSCWAVVCEGVWVGVALGAVVLESAAYDGMASRISTRIAGVIHTSGRFQTKLSGGLRSRRMAIKKARIAAPEGGVILARCRDSGSRS